MQLSFFLLIVLNESYCILNVRVTPPPPPPSKEDDFTYHFYNEKFMRLRIMAPHNILTIRGL